MTTPALAVVKTITEAEIRDVTHYRHSQAALRYSTLTTRVKGFKRLHGPYFTFRVRICRRRPQLGLENAH